jgi:hypothetical protein
LRGAADLATIETELTAMMGAMAGGPLIKNLDRALRTVAADKWNARPGGMAPRSIRATLLVFAGQ